MELNRTNVVELHVDIMDIVRGSLVLECLADICPITAEFAQLNHFVQYEIIFFCNNLCNAQCNLVLRNH